MATVLADGDPREAAQVDEAVPVPRLARRRPKENGMKRIVLVLVVAALLVPFAACRGRQLVITPPPTAYAPAPAYAPPAAPPVVVAPLPPSAPIGVEPVAVVPPPAEIIVEPPATAMEPLAPPPPPPPPAEEPPVVVPEPLAPAALPPAEEPAAPSPAVEPAAPSPDEYLAEVARQAQIERQKQQVLVQDYLEKARTALSQGDLEGGRHWYSEVLSLDPGTWKPAAAFATSPVSARARSARCWTARAAWRPSAASRRPPR